MWHIAGSFSSPMDVFVKENLTGNPLATVNLEYKANRIYTIYIIGNQSNVELVQAVDGNTYACPR